MSIYYTVACHTCKQRKDLAGCADSAVVKEIGEWARYSHFSHDIVVVNDMMGWDDDFDVICDKVMKYEEIRD